MKTREECTNPLWEQVMNTPDFAVRLNDSLSPDKFRDVLSMKEIYDIKRVIVTGCGDSYMAGIAMKPAFEKLTGLRTDVMRMIEFNRHLDSGELGQTPGNPLVIIISVSGGFARVIEAAKRGTKYGAMTLAVTDRPESPMAKECRKVLKMDIPLMGEGVGASSYVSTSTTMLHLAARIGYVRGVIGEADVQDIRDSLVSFCKSYQDIMPKLDDQMWELANRWKDLDRFDFVGDAADFATAFFGAAKMVETFGAMCSWDDSEDWCHIGFFARNPKTIGTGLVANPYSPSFSRCLETAKGMSLLHRPTLVVTTAEKSAFPEGLDVCTLPAAKYDFINPIMQNVAFGLLAARLYPLKGIEPFRAGDTDFDLGGYNGRDSSEVEIV